MKHVLCSNSFIHSDHFYSTSSSPLPLRNAPDAARILCRSFTLKRHRELQVKDWSKVPKWWLERDSNPRPSVERYQLNQCATTSQLSNGSWIDESSAVLKKLDS